MLHTPHPWNCQSGTDMFASLGTASHSKQVRRDLTDESYSACQILAWLLALRMSEKTSKRRRKSGGIHSIDIDDNSAEI